MVLLCFGLSVGQIASQNFTLNTSMTLLSINTNQTISFWIEFFFQWNYDALKIIRSKYNRPKKTVTETVYMMKTLKWPYVPFRQPFSGFHHVNSLCHSIFGPFWGPSRMIFYLEILTSWNNEVSYFTNISIILYRFQNCYHAKHIIAFPRALSRKYSHPRKK